MLGVFNVIRIGMDPYLIQYGNFVLTWHGFFTFVGVLFAIFLVAHWAKKDQILPDTVFSVALWAILGGIIGARLLHVIDFWGRIYKNDPVSALYVWQGGIGIYGAVLGGFVGGAIFVTIRNKDGLISFWNRWFKWLGKIEKIDLPSVGRLADLAAPAVLISMAIGRIGDIINGEHIARVTSLPWAFVYDHPDTQRLYAFIGDGQSSLSPAHPAVVYEMMWDFVIAGLLWFVFRGRLRPHGMMFVAFLGLYSLGRFFISFVRLDKIWIVGLDASQIVALTTLFITMTILISKGQWIKRNKGNRVETEAVSPEAVS